MAEIGRREERRDRDSWFQRMLEIKGLTTYDSRVVDGVCDEEIEDGGQNQKYDWA